MSAATTSTTEATPEILIPSLPNDIALQCLARVPRRYHPVLAAVSKHIRSLLSSPEFFAVRSALNCTEILPYVRIQNGDIHPRGFWFTLCERQGERPNFNSAKDEDDKSNFIIAPVPGDPRDRQDLYNYVAVGPKIYALDGKEDGIYSPEVWIFDCRFHTWEQGPSFHSGRKYAAQAVSLDGKIYLIGTWTEEDSWTEVFDTVSGRWETFPNPELGVYGDGKPVSGFVIKSGKICVWVEGDELRLDPATKLWEVFVDSAIGFGLSEYEQMCQVNGVLYCLPDEDYDHNNNDYMFKRFDDEIGKWEKIKLVNGSDMPDKLRELSLVCVGERLVIMGFEMDETLSESELSKAKMRLWILEIEVKKRGDGVFRGEVLRSEVVYPMPRCFYYRPAHFYYECIPVSL